MVNNRALRNTFEFARGFFAKHLQKRNDFDISSQDIRYEYGFGFESLYHPYVEALKLGKESSATELLFDFFSEFDQFLMSFSSDEERLPVQVLKHKPTHLRDLIRDNGGRLGQLAGGTLAPARAAATKAEHLFSIKRSILKYGFNPDVSGFGSGLDGIYVGGKFLLLGGQHRAAVMYSMGQRVFRVRLRTTHGSIPCFISPHGSFRRLDLVKAAIIAPSDLQRMLARIEQGLSKTDAKHLNFPFA